MSKNPSAFDLLPKQTVNIYRNLLLAQNKYIRFNNLPYASMMRKI